MTARRVTSEKPRRHQGQEVGAMPKNGPEDACFSNVIPFPEATRALAPTATLDSRRVHQRAGEPWTAEESAELARLAASGMKLKLIALSIGRTVAAVRSHAVRSQISLRRPKRGGQGPGQ
jgi:DNA-binding NarL/FixJ family response regulator